MRVRVSGEYFFEGFLCRAWIAAVTGLSRWFRVLHLAVGVQIEDTWLFTYAASMNRDADVIDESSFLENYQCWFCNIY